MATLWPHDWQERLTGPSAVSANTAADADATAAATRAAAAPAGSGTIEEVAGSAASAMSNQTHSTVAPSESGGSSGSSATASTSGGLTERLKRLLPLSDKASAADLLQHSKVGVLVQSF